MKIFLIDEGIKIKRINKELEKYEIENIELKENCKFKMTKKDYMIITDDSKFDDLEKLKNIIIIVKNKDYKYIWQLANTYRTIDIIDSNMSDEYIAKRIEKIIRREV